MACNGLCGAGKDTFIGPPALDKFYSLNSVNIAVLDHDVFQLLADFEILIGFAEVWFRLETVYCSCFVCLSFVFSYYILDAFHFSTCLNFPVSICCDYIFICWLQVLLISVKTEISIGLFLEESVYKTIEFRFEMHVLFLL